MNPAHADQILPVQRRSDGSIDYGHYDTRARMARSRAFRTVGRWVRQYCRMAVASCLGRRSGTREAGQTPDHVVAIRRPQTFVENYLEIVHRKQGRYSKAA